MRNIALWLLVVTLVSLIGAIGYMVLEGWPFFDALYMTVITLATVGYKEVHPMDRPGEIWTMVFALASVALIFGTVGIAAESLVAEFGSGKREVKRMQNRVAALHDHYIVCGYGRVGSLVAHELRLDGHDVVVLDIAAASLDRAVSDGHLVVPGDGTSDEVLKLAGVERARGLVAAIDSDANNVYVTITARTLNPSLFIVARAGAASVMNKLRQAGADRAISPYVMAGRRIAQLALRPGVVDFIEAALSRAGMEFALEEVTVNAALAGGTVGDLRGRGLFTLAIRAGEGDFEATPPDDRALGAGESLIVAGSGEAIRALNEQARRAG